MVEENLKLKLCLEYFIQIIDSSFVDSLSTYHYLIRVRFEACQTGQNSDKVENAKIIKVCFNWYNGSVVLSTNFVQIIEKINVSGY